MSVVLLAALALAESPTEALRALTPSGEAQSFALVCSPLGEVLDAVVPFTPDYAAQAEDGLRRRIEPLIDRHRAVRAGLDPSGTLTLAATDDWLSLTVPWSGSDAQIEAYLEHARADASRGDASWTLPSANGDVTARVDGAQLHFDQGTAPAPSAGEAVLDGLDAASGCALYAHDLGDRLHGRFGLEIPMDDGPVHLRAALDDRPAPDALAHHQRTPRAPRTHSAPLAVLTVAAPGDAITGMFPEDGPLAHLGDVLDAASPGARLALFRSDERPALALIVPFRGGLGLGAPAKRLRAAIDASGQPVTWDDDRRFHAELDGWQVFGRVRAGELQLTTTEALTEELAKGRGDRWGAPRRKVDDWPLVLEIHGALGWPLRSSDLALDPADSHPWLLGVRADEGVWDLTLDTTSRGTTLEALVDVMDALQAQSTGATMLDRAIPRR